jgi:hypothetical protein
MAASILNLEISKYHPVAIAFDNKGGFETYIVSRKMNIPISENQPFALVCKITNNENKSKGLGFTRHGEIKKTYKREPYSNSEIQQQNEKRKAENLEPLVYFKHPFDVEQSVEIEEPYSIKEICFSLLKTNNYKTPYRSFCRQLTTISNNDLETIVNQYIYVDRTIIGSLLYSLPDELFFEFLQFALSETQNIEVNKIDLNRGRDLLKKYIDWTVFEPNSYIDEITKTSNILFDDKIAQEISFKEEGFKTNHIFNLAKQSELSKELLNQRSLSSLFEDLSNQGSRKKFETLFQNKRWPIRIA